jgi:hypothetical protein
MNPEHPMVGQLRAERRKIVINLAVNAFLPVFLYAFLRHLDASDLLSLGLATAIPGAWTLMLAAFKRRVNWIGIFSMLWLASASGLSLLTNGDSFIVKVRGLFLSGPLGLVLFLSALIGKPLLLPLWQLLAPEAAGSLRQKKPVPFAVHRKITFVTGGIGLALLGQAVLETAMALKLTTGAFMVASNVATWAFVGVCLFFFGRFRRRQLHKRQV